MSEHTKRTITPKRIVLTLLLGGVAAVGLLVLLGRFDVPFVRQDKGWSIGIYSGDSPTNFHPARGIKNPVLTASDVTDVTAQFVADPFMVQESNTWYLFMEVKNAATRQGDIGLATSADTLHWKYERIVLDEPFHLSYPYVFKWEGRYYMIPESVADSSVRLYEASTFPTQWRHVTNLLTGVKYADSSVVRHDNKWWMFTSGSGDSSMFIYYAETLTGPWQAHKLNPVIQNAPDKSRHGGRLLVDGKNLYRYAQIDVPTYGFGLRAFEVLELTADEFREREVAGFGELRASGRGWNRNGMHTLDPHQLPGGGWVGCVDGTGRVIRFGR